MRSIEDCKTCHERGRSRPLIAPPSPPDVLVTLLVSESAGDSETIAVLSDRRSHCPLLMASIVSTAEIA